MNANTKTNKMFIKELFDGCPHYKALDKYAGTKVKIKIKCTKCNNIWESTPDNLKQRWYGKEGCPKCQQEIRGYVHKPVKRHEQFLIDLYKVRKDIKIMSKYTGIKNQIKFKCLVCTKESSMLADNLLHNRYRCQHCSNQEHKEKRQQYVEKQLEQRGIKILNWKTNKVACALGHSKHTWYAKDINTILHVKCPVCARKSWHENGGYKWKTVSIKGKKFKLQGYEDLGIKYCLKHGANIETIEAGSRIGFFKYKHGGDNHIYFPDIYVPEIRTYFEVKSSYTFLGAEAWFLRTITKRKSVVKANYKFKLLVFDKQHKLLKLPKIWWKLSFRQLQAQLIN